MVYGQEAYFTSGWNIMDGSLVIISIIDLLMSLVSEGSPRIFNILRVNESFSNVPYFSDHKAYFLSLEVLHNILLAFFGPKVHQYDLNVTSRNIIFTAVV